MVDFAAKLGVHAPVLLLVSVADERANLLTGKQLHVGWSYDLAQIYF